MKEREMFDHRVKRFYLEPAKYLNKENHAFASGLICVATIDFLARILPVKILDKTP